MDSPVKACAGCGDHLQYGQILFALGTSWHVWCSWHVLRMRGRLQGEYMSHAGRPLCLRDCNQKFGVRCFECDRYFVGKVLEVHVAGRRIDQPEATDCSAPATTGPVPRGGPAGSASGKAPLAFLIGGQRRAPSWCTTREPKCRTRIPDMVPPIDREDFPAPPYPYAAEEMKRRLSSSSVENDTSDEEAEAERRRGGACSAKTGGKQRPRSRCSGLAAGEALINRARDQAEAGGGQRAQAAKGLDQRLHCDPRNASRKPSAKKMPHLKFRYDTPINASPSPEPAQALGVLEDGRPNGRPGCHHHHHSMLALTAESDGHHGGGGAARAATIPEGYAAYYARGGAATTISSHYSDNSLDLFIGGPAGCVPRCIPCCRTCASGEDLSVRLVSDFQQAFCRRMLIASTWSREEFEQYFEMTPIEFYKLPERKRINLKRKLKLF